MKQLRPRLDGERSATIVHSLGLIAGCSVLCGLTALASDPAWWISSSAVHPPEVVTNSGVVTTNYISNDYAAVLQGQLKLFTSKAVAEMNAKLSGGAGTNLNSILTNWATDYDTNGYGATNIKPSDHDVMTVGQLKSIGGMVYERLSSAGYTNLAPSWLPGNSNNNSHVAVLGQLKQVFDFDFSLPPASNLVATTAVPGTVNLNWLKSTNNTSPWVIEQQNSDGTWKFLTNLSNTANSYSVSGLTNGQSYTFQVFANGTNNVSTAARIEVTADASFVLSPPPARYFSSQTVTVTSSLSTATIYYTTDGSDPTTSSPSISNGAQINVTANTLYKFLAVDGTTSSPINPALYRIDGSTQLQAGDSFTMGQKANGSVWTWGDNSRGQQGDNQTHNPAITPQQLSSLTNIVTIAAAGDHAFAVKSDGSVWAWGANDQSQCGDGITIDALVPEQISGLSSIVSVYAGQDEGFAVDSSGALYGWGANSQGQLGDGTSSDHSTPEIISSVTGVVKVCASNGQTLVLKNDGTVWAAGVNGHGELGDGTYTSASMFQLIPGITDIIDIAVGYDSFWGGHCLALKADGSIWSWGADWLGELGDGDSVHDKPTPHQISLPTATGVFATDTKSYVLLYDGTVRAFGGNEEGTWGTGSAGYFNSLPQTPLDVSDVTGFAAGIEHVVVGTSTGALMGWGDNSLFQLGENINNLSRNTEVHDDSALNFISVASAETATIGLKNDGTVWAVGNNSDGLMGQGGTELTSTKQMIQVGSLSNIIQIAGGEDTAFAIDLWGSLLAWGQNGSGQLGVGSASSVVNVPSVVANVENVVAVGAGNAHMLAVQSDGTVWATGDDSHGELGDGSTTSATTPIPVTALNSVFAETAAAGTNTSFVLDSDGNVWAWGENESGQLGFGTTSDVGTPTEIPGVPPMVAIVARDNNAMGIDIYGDVWTWGVFGNSDGTPQMQTGLTNATKIAAGIGHCLAVDSDGVLWGWGNSGGGQLGNGTFDFEVVPTQVGNVQGAVAIAANYQSSFVVKSDGMLSGFGQSFSGELGASLGSINYEPRALFGATMNTPPPSISITSPGLGIALPNGTPIHLQSTASASSGSVVEVDYYLEGVEIGSSGAGGTWDIMYQPQSTGDYTFEAVAYDSAGVAMLSSPRTVSIISSDPGAVAIAAGLAPPTDLTVTLGSAGRLIINWVNNATDATSLIIQISTDGAIWTDVDTLLDTGSTTYTIGDLTPGQPYEVRVVAQKTNTTTGKTEQSAAQSIEAVAPSAAQYAVIDLGVDAKPQKITNTGFVLYGGNSGTAVWRNGNVTLLQSASGNAFQANDITEDGIVIGTDGTSPSGIEAQAVWLTGSTTPSVTPGSGSNAKRGIAIDSSYDKWTFETISVGTNGYSFSDGYKNGGKLGTATVNGTNGNLSGISVSPVAVNNDGDLISNNSDTASSNSVLSLFTGKNYSGSVTSFNSTNHQVLSWFPADISNEIQGDCFVVSVGAGYGVWWNSFYGGTGNTAFGLVTYPLSVNSAKDVSNTPYVQVVSGSSLWGYNPETLSFGSPLNLNNLVSDDQWTSITAGDYPNSRNSGHSINDAGGIVATALSSVDSTRHGVILCPMTVIDSDKHALAYVRYGLWDNAFTTTSGSIQTLNNDFIDNDSRRFYLQVYDPSAIGDPNVTEEVHANWFTETPSGGLDDDGNLLGQAPGDDTITLTETAPGTGIFRSQALILVSDDVDNQLLGLTSANAVSVGMPAVGQAEHRMRRVSLGGRMGMSYTPAETGAQKATALLSIFNLSPAIDAPDKIKTLNVQMASTRGGHHHNLPWDDGPAKVLKSNLISRLAIAGIDAKVAYQPIISRNFSDVVTISDKHDLTKLDVYLDEVADHSGSSIGMQGQIATAVKAHYPRASAKTVFVILINKFETQVDGVATQGQSYSKGYIAYSSDMTPSLNCCLVAYNGTALATSATTCVAPHECTHLLTCPTAAYLDVADPSATSEDLESGGHYGGNNYSQNLEMAHAADPLPGSVTNSKRLWNDAGHAYIKIPNSTNPIQKQIDFMRADDLLQ